MSTDYMHQNPTFRAYSQQILHLRGVTTLTPFRASWIFHIYFNQLRLITPLL